jgi:hypothetical protein
MYEQQAAPHSPVIIVPDTDHVGLIQKPQAVSAIVKRGRQQGPVTFKGDWKDESYSI